MNVGLFQGVVCVRDFMGGFSSIEVLHPKSDLRRVQAADLGWFTVEDVNEWSLREDKMFQERLKRTPSFHNCLYVYNSMLLPPGIVDCMEHWGNYTLHELAGSYAHGSIHHYSRVHVVAPEQLPPAQDQIEQQLLGQPWRPARKPVEHSTKAEMEEFLAKIENLLEGDEELPDDEDAIPRNVVRR